MTGPRPRVNASLSVHLVVSVAVRGLAQQPDRRLLLGVQGLGFRVQGLGFGFWGLRGLAQQADRRLLFRVGLGFRVQGLGFMQQADRRLLPCPPFRF